MGCWNETCAISKLPILYNEKIKLVFLHSRYVKFEIIGKSGYCNTTDILCPMFLPISGEYNDYGSIQNINKDWNYNIIENYLKNTLGSVIAIQDDLITDWTLEYIIKGIERGKLTNFKNDKNELVNMSFVMIREDIWDHIVKNYVGDFNDYDNQKYHISCKEWCENEFKKCFYVDEEIIQSMRDNNIDEIKINEQILRLQFRNNIFSNDEFRLKSNIEYNNWIHNDKCDKDDVLKQLFEYISVSSYMSETRIGWMIQCGSGSQNQDWELHKLLANKIIDICDNKINEEEEY
jgi:hypothetical protein